MTTYTNKELAFGGWYETEIENSEGETEKVWKYISSAEKTGIQKIDVVLSATTKSEAEKELKKYTAEYNVEAETKDLIFGTDYNGAGMNIIMDAMTGTTRPEAFALKLVFTVITIAGGYKGGEIVPSFFIGATFGNLFGILFGLPPQFTAALGLVSLFCGVVNCPVTSLLLSIELFGGEGILFFAAACSVSYILSGYYGLYTGQKIMYSKLHSKYINRHTK